MYLYFYIYDIFKHKAKTILHVLNYVIIIIVFYTIKT